MVNTVPYIETERNIRMKWNWKLILMNSILVLSSVFFTYLLIEFFLFRILLPYSPLKLYGYIPEASRILAQSSKKATFPKDYVALIGDSYAQGEGDWLRSANISKNPDYHSAHVIYRQTGRDVISFGRSGAGSLNGIVCAPISNYEYLKTTLLYKVQAPQDFIIYFYEGNDLNDNLLSIRTLFDGKYDRNKIYDSGYFREFINKAVLPWDHLYKAKEGFRWYSNLFFARSLRAILFPKNKVHDEHAAPDIFTPGSVNKIMLGQDIVDIPDGLQSPSLELTEDEITLSVYVFEQSLKYLKEYFPQSRIGVIYIPSPLSTYKLVSDQVDIETYEGRSKVYDRDLVKQRSDEIAASIQTIAGKCHVSFEDARNEIDQYAQKELLHGPKDWNHFNQKGYTILATIAQRLLRKMGEERFVK